MNACLVIVPHELELPPELTLYFDILEENLGFATLYQTRFSSEMDFQIINYQLALHGFIRLFESFWMPDGISSTLKKSLTQALFSKIADDYDLIVTSKRNISCYDYLYAAAKRHLRRNAANVLDFGCGTGLIMRSQLGSENLVLKGFDSNQRMVELAQEKGLASFGPEIYKIKDNGPFDIILASYVFHYQLDDDDWPSLLRSLADGGVLLGNFHKGIGLSEARSAVQFFGSSYQPRVMTSPFGPVLIASSGSKGTGVC